MIRFLLDDTVEQIENISADTTLLNYLREHKHLTGSKEGCASGDCGACTVVLASLNESHGGLQYTPINSCVTFLSALEGKQLLTVEHLAKDGLHPVQEAMVTHHASQCGFCTPGFVMSMFALFKQSGEVSREKVNVALSGNLCRCTGYRPIIDAALDVCSKNSEDRFSAAQADTIDKLKSLQQNPEQGSEHLMMPRDREQLMQCIQANPEANLFAGSTDLALDVTQKLTSMPKLISLGQVKELNRVEEQDTGLFIGAALSLSDIEQPLIARFPELSELLERFAATPIRNQATLGGNVANASPIGDMPPVLLALNAQICVDNGTSRRQIDIKQFFTGYRQTAMQANEWIEGIFIPNRIEQTQLRAYKVSKRFEDDISAVCAVFNLELDKGVVRNINSGFGGVAATPETLSALAQLNGKTWAEKSTLQLGKDILAQGFNPIDDVRASAEYRQKMLVNLWHRFWLQTNQTNNTIETRVVTHA